MTALSADPRMSRMSSPVAEALEKFNGEFRAFKEREEAWRNEMQAQVDELAKKAGRVGIGAVNGGGMDPRSNEMKAFGEFLRAGDESAYQKFQASMETGNDPNGGYAVPDAMSKQMAMVALDYSPMRKLATVEPSPKGRWQKLISTDGAGAEWVGENDTRNETSTPPLAVVTPPNGGISAIAPVTRWLLQDAEFDIAAFVVAEIGKKHGISEGAAFISGNGIKKPSGLLSGTLSTANDGSRDFGTLQKLASGASGAVVADKLIDLLYLLKPEYRAQASWLMNGTTLAQVRKLKNSTNDYLFEPSMQRGTPGTLLGLPVFEDPNMPTPAADANAIAVGDFKRGYTITDVGVPILIRDEVTQKGKVLFYVERRVGGAVIDSNAIKILTLT